MNFQSWLDILLPVFKALVWYYTTGSKGQYEESIRYRTVLLRTCRDNLGNLRLFTQLSNDMSVRAQGYQGDPRDEDYLKLEVVRLMNKYRLYLRPERVKFYAMWQELCPEDFE